MNPRKILLPLALAAPLLGLGCVAVAPAHPIGRVEVPVYQPAPVYVPRGQVIYRYYPGENIYYNTHDQIWLWRTGAVWHSGPRLPEGHYRRLGPYRDIHVRDGQPPWAYRSDRDDRGPGRGPGWDNPGRGRDRDDNPGRGRGGGYRSDR